MNALLDLAWAALPEEAIVAKVAAQVVRDSDCWKYSWRYKSADLIKSQVKTHIDDSRPPRGFKRKRLDAVLKEAPRQSKLRNEREQNAPIDWASWRRPTPAKRRKHLYESIVGQECESCHYLRQWHGHLIMVANQSSNAFLVIRHPGGRLDFVSLGWIYDLTPKNAIQQAMTLLAPRLVREAILDGSRLTFDFCGLRTIAAKPDGRTETECWKARYHPIGPQRACAENYVP